MSITQEILKMASVDIFTEAKSRYILRKRKIVK